MNFLHAIPRAATRPIGRAGRALLPVVCMIALAAAAWAEQAAPAPAPPDASAAPAPAGPGQPAPGQSGQSDRLQEAEKKAEDALAAPGAKSAEGSSRGAKEEVPQLNALDLAVKGGILMIPITGMSILTVIFGVERLLGLRRRKVLPTEMVVGLGQMAGQRGGFDPRQVYRLCQQYPSSAANVLRAMLLKVGRPLTEVEQALKDAKEREADRLYAHVRFLSLSAVVTPLLGLLGTVQGMIQAFFVTAHLGTGVNKAESLAQGIYVALVTTFAGLCVAIPASVMAHYFEGRIQRLFREFDETLLGLLPQLERFEDRLRVSKDQLEQASAAPLRTAPPEEPRKVPASTVLK